MDDTIYREAAVKHLKHRLYETATNNDDLSGVFVEIAEHRIETWIGEVPSADPDVITMRVDIDREQFEKAWKQALASSPLTVFPDEELDTGLYVDGFDDGFKAGTQRWIPVTERMPEEYQKAICTNKHNEMMIGTYTKYGWMFPCYFETPIAWMPLPPVYQGE